MAAGRSLSSRVRALPPRRRRIALAAALIGYAVLVSAFVVVGQALVGDEPVDWVQSVVTALGVVLAVCVSVGVGSWLPWHRRRVARAERMRPFETAARTGRLPADVDPAVWHPFLVERQQTQRRRTTRALVAVAVLAAVLLTMALLFWGVAVLPVVVWLLVSVQLVNLVWSSGNRQQQRLAAMIDRLPRVDQPTG